MHIKDRHFRAMERRDGGTSQAEMNVWLRAADPELHVTEEAAESRRRRSPFVGFSPAVDDVFVTKREQAFDVGVRARHGHTSGTSPFLAY